MKYFVPDVAILGGGYTLESLTQGEGINIPAPVNALATLGYFEPGDNGGGVYKRVEVEPSHAGWFQSADGAFWELQRGNNNILQFGAINSGLEVDAAANNTAIINALEFLQEGDDLNFSRALFWVDGEITISKNNLRLYNGRLKKSAASEMPIFIYGTTTIVVDNIDIVDFDFDGNKSEFAVGDRGSAVEAYYATNCTFTNVRAHDFPDDGVKTINCSGFSFVNCAFNTNFNCGIELNTYSYDIRTGVAPTVPVPDIVGGYIVSACRFVGNNDNSAGVLNGVGIGFNVSEEVPIGTPLPVEDMVFSGLIFQDNLRAMQTENYVTRANNLAFAGIAIRGEVTGDVDCYSGIGLISVSNVAMSAVTMTDIGHFDPAPTVTFGLAVSATNPALPSQFVNINTTNAIETLSSGDRMTYGFNIQALSNSFFNGAIAVNAEGNDIRVEDSNTSNIGFVGSMFNTDELSWIKPIAYNYRIDNITANASALAWSSAINETIEGQSIGLNGRIVGISVVLSTQITAGAGSIHIYKNGVDIGILDLDQSDFGAGLIASARVGTKDGIDILPTDTLKVYFTTSAGFLPTGTMDASATVYIDTGIFN